MVRDHMGILGAECFWLPGPHLLVDFAWPLLDRTRLLGRVVPFKTCRAPQRLRQAAWRALQAASSHVQAPLS